MSHINNSYIDSLGYNIEAWTALSEQEKEKAIESYLEGLDETERTEALETLEQELDEIKDQLKEYADDLEDIQRGNDVSEEDAADIEKWLEEIDDMLKAINEADDLADDVNDDIAKHNRDYSDGSDASISTLELDGETYTFTMGGSTTNPFNSNQTDEQWLKEEGIINEAGEVIDDVNNDTIKNHADIEEALKARNDPSLKQGIYIQDGNNWQLVSNDDDSGTVTFKVTDNEGNFSFVTFENASDIVFHFSNGITADDMDTLKDLWPPKLLKRSYWTNDTESSFYDHLFGDEVAPKERLQAIQGYSDTTNDFNEVAAYTNPGGKPASALEPYYQEAIDALFGFLDDPTDKDMGEIWAELFASWESAGLNEADIANLIHYIVIKTALDSSDHFATFFGPVITTLEDKLGYDKGREDGENLLEADKTVILLLESYAGVGEYGGVLLVWADVFATDETESGRWTLHDENIRAIEAFKNIASQGGLSLTGNENMAIENEEAIQGTGPDGLPEGGENGETGYEQAFDDYLLAKVSTYNTDVSQANMREFITLLKAHMLDENGLRDEEISVLEALQYALFPYGENQDDMINNLVKMLMDAANSDDPDIRAFADLFLGDAAVVDYMIRVLKRHSGFQNELKKDEQDQHDYLVGLNPS